MSNVPELFINPMSEALELLRVDDTMSSTNAPSRVGRVLCDLLRKFPNACVAQRRIIHDQ